MEEGRLGEAGSGWGWVEWKKEWSEMGGEKKLIHCDKGGE